MASVYPFGPGLVTQATALQYIASHPDLSAAFGADPAAGVAHFQRSGFAEHREITFDSFGYLGTYADLYAAFGTDPEAAARHFITVGRAEGRTVGFDPLAYIASYADLIAAFGADPAAAVTHLYSFGLSEGRTASFDAAGYLARYGDLRAAFGTDERAATIHFIQFGFREGRTDDPIPPSASGSAPDTEAPGAPAILAFAEDSGTSGDQVTNDATPAVSGIAEAGATVTVLLDGIVVGTTVAAGNGAWTVALLALTDGPHSVTATAADATGNTSVTSTPFVVTIDTAAPDAPVMLTFTDDSGAADGLTNDATPTVSGTAEPGAIVTVFVDGDEAGTTIADGSGQWSLTVPGLTDGPHSITATARDAAGNIGAASAPLEVTIDTEAPDAPAILSLACDSGTAGDGITNDATLKLSGTAEPGAIVAVFVDGEAAGTVVAGDTGAWKLTLGTLDEGEYSITATATDAAGNTSAASDTFAVTIDMTEPDAPVILGIADDSGTAGDEVTNDTTVTLSGTAEVGATVAVYRGGSILVGTVVALDGTWTLDVPALSEGSYSFTATATDVAGNTSAASDALAVTIDATEPDAPVILGIADDSGTAGDGVTGDATVTLSGTAEAGATVAVYRDGSTLVGTVVATDGTWTLDIPELPEGSYSFTATAMDAAGNTGAASDALAVTIDATEPDAPVILGIADDTGTAGDGVTNDTTVTLSGTAEAGATVAVYRDGSTLVGTVVAVDGTWMLDVPELSEGAYSFTATAMDLAGNTSAASDAFVVDVDTTAPTLTIELSDNALGAGETALATFTFSEVVSGFTASDVALPIGVVLSDFQTGDGRIYTATLTPPAATTLNGSVSVAIGTYRDGADNPGEAATVPISIDTVLPSLSITATDAVKNEGGAGQTTAFTFTVTRSGSSFGPTSVDWAVGGGSAAAGDFVDGSLPFGTLSFAAGETSKTITVNVAGDAANELNESFTVLLSDASNAVIGTGSAVGQINTDDSAEFRVNTTTTNFQYGSSIAMDQDGDFVVAWTSQGSGVAADRIHIQRYDAGGVLQGSDTTVYTGTSNDQEDASVAMDASGKFAVVWTSASQSGADRIYVQLHEADGDVQTAAATVYTGTNNDQEDASVAMDQDGDFAVIWTSEGQGNNPDRVYAQLYDETGTKQGSAFLVTAATNNDQRYGGIAMEDNGDFVVTWSWRDQDGSDWGVYAQRHAADGNAIGSAFQVNTTTQGDQEYSSVAMDQDGDFVITWTGQDGAGTGIHGQRYNANGERVGGEFLVNTVVTGNQTFSSVAMDDNGNFMVSWRSSGQDGSGDGVYGQRFSADGTRLGFETRLTASTAGDQTQDDTGQPNLAISDDGSIIAATWYGSPQISQTEVYASLIA